MTRGWLYDGQLAIVAELDGQGQIVSRFVYGERLNVPEYMVRNARTYRLITDERGSVRLVVDVASGSVEQRLDYDAFGSVILNTNPGFQPFAFAGGLYDDDAGLLRFGSRDYDPHAGRWTVRDPLLFQGGDANLYAYAGNDPVNRIDPNGRSVFWVGVGIGAAIGAVEGYLTGGTWAAAGRGAALGAAGGFIGGGVGAGFGVLAKGFGPLARVVIRYQLQLWAAGALSGGITNIALQAIESAEKEGNVKINDWGSVIRTTILGGLSGPFANLIASRVTSGVASRIFEQVEEGAAVVVAALLDYTFR